MHVFFCECMIDKDYLFTFLLFFFSLLFVSICFPCVCVGGGWGWMCVCLRQFHFKYLHQIDRSINILGLLCDSVRFGCLPFCIVQCVCVYFNYSDGSLCAREFMFSFMFGFHKLPYHCNTHLLSSCVFISFT